MYPPLHLKHYGSLFEVLMRSAFTLEEDEVDPKSNLTLVGLGETEVTERMEVWFGYWYV
jgi:hypothetical protein